MKKYTYLFVVALIVAIMAPAIAQEPFVDLDPNHWAYDAVLQLQAAGIIDGYPDQTFSGKRTLTRYEFASALAKILPLIPDVSGLPTAEDIQALQGKFDGVATKDDLAGFATKEDLQKFLGNADEGKFAVKGDLDKFVTKGDLERISRLVNEFQDELKNLGVDVAGVKRDINALGTRVDAIEAELARVKVSGSFTTFAVTARNWSANAAETADQVAIDPATSLIGDVSVVRDFDLTVTGRVNENTKVTGVINYGNLLDYLQNREYTKNPQAYADAFTPFYMFIDTKLGMGDVTVGRFPISFTPYTLKKYDIDSYTNIVKTDDGNYAIDGAKACANVYGADLTVFAGKTTGNAWEDFYAISDYDQIAGARATMSPFGGNLGVTYINAWSINAAPYDRLEVYGADYSTLLFGKYNLSGSWTTSNMLIAEGSAGIAGTNFDNDAWDAKVATGFGKIGFAGGYKNIGQNFRALGSWDKIFNMINPTDVKGPYANISYPIMSNLKLGLSGEYLTKDFDANIDKELKAQGSLNFGLNQKTALTADVEYYVRNLKTLAANAENPTGAYVTFGVNRDLGANANMRVGYSFISWNDGTQANAAGYHAGLGVVQFGVSF